MNYLKSGGERMSHWAQMYRFCCRYQCFLSGLVKSPLPNWKQMFCTGRKGTTQLIALRLMCTYKTKSLPHLLSIQFANAERQSDTVIHKKLIMPFRYFQSIKNAISEFKIYYGRTQSINSRCCIYIGRFYWSKWFIWSKSNQFSSNRLFRKLVNGQHKQDWLIDGHIT